jgi:hypothetical protein
VRGTLENGAAHGSHGCVIGDGPNVGNGPGGGEPGKVGVLRRGGAGLSRQGGSARGAFSQRRHRVRKLSIKASLGRRGQSGQSGCRLRHHLIVLREPPEAGLQEGWRRAA